MRNVAGILLFLALLSGMLLLALSRLVETPQAAASAPRLAIGSGTPMYFPMIYKVPTLTPTVTRTPTITPSPTKTLTPVPATATRTGVPGATALQGRVVMQKARFYAVIEWIWFYEQLYNPTGSPKPYTLLGVNVTGPNASWVNPRFHTSWTGSPDYVLSGCWGPNGDTDWNQGFNYRCGLTSNDGWHTDHVGASSNVEINTPGHYWVEFWACISSYFECTTPGQNPTWLKLGDAQFDADPPPPGAHAVATHMPQTKCGLITTDPNNIYLKCDD
jgi:hypothetical protein